MRTTTATVVGTAAFVIALSPVAAHAQSGSGGAKPAASSGWTLPVPASSPCRTVVSSASRVVCDTSPGHYAIIEEGASLDARYAALGYTKRPAVNLPWRYLKPGARTVCFTVGILENSSFQITGSRWNGSVEGTNNCR